MPAAPEKDAAQGLGSTLPRDMMSGLIVFLVALPLCLGIALASDAPLFSGLLAGIVGGIVVGFLSGSHTSVSGPAAGLTAIVAAQIAELGSFETFFLAVMIAGVLQVVLGLVKAGTLSAFFPSSVIKGLLAAIGTILIIKQIPFLLGYDMVPKGDAHGHATIIDQIKKIFTGEIHRGALAIGLVSMVFLIVWDKIPKLKKSLVPSPLLVVLLGVIGSIALSSVGGSWALSNAERLMVNVPVAKDFKSFMDFLTLPDFTQWNNSAVYIAAITIAIVASLETLLNLDAVDKLDKKQRLSPPSRELLAQGVGNICCGLIGGLPVTSVVIRGSVNVYAGSQTKVSAIFHGILLLVCVGFIPTYLNQIPLSCLAAILLMTGFKLASPALMKTMWNDGRSQFIPFIVTLVGIVATDLLIGILIGLGVSLLFILKSNLTVPIRKIVEKHVGGEVLRIELANQVSFLNRAALETALRSGNPGSHILLDARRTDYIDPDVLALIKEFKKVTAPALGVTLSLRGFRDSYQLADEIQFVDYATRELRAQLTPARVLQILEEGNDRFISGQRIDRDLTRRRSDGSSHEHPMAVIFSGINPRTPSEMVFDLGLGDIYSIRLAGATSAPAVLASMEYACVVGGAKLIVVMGHGGSGIVQSALERSGALAGKGPWADCENLQTVLTEIESSVDPADQRASVDRNSIEWHKVLEKTARRNVLRTVQQIAQQSTALKKLLDEQKLTVVGALLDNSTGRVEFFRDSAVGASLKSSST